MADIIVVQPKQSWWKKFLKGLAAAAIGGAVQAATQAISTGNLNPKDIAKTVGITAAIAAVAYLQNPNGGIPINATQARQIEFVNTVQAKQEAAEQTATTEAAIKEIIKP